MGFLSNINNEIVLDAVLTKYGREKLASGQDLGISKFALADDEVDYVLYSTANPFGSDYYDIAITRLPILEAIPNTPTVLRYRLFTSAAGVTSPFMVQYSVPTVFSTGISSAPTSFLIGPSIYPALSDISGVWYKFEVNPINVVYMSIQNGINQSIGYPNDLALAVQTQQDIIDTGHNLNYALGQFATLNILALPVSPTTFTITITGYGPGISTRPYSFNFNLNANAGLTVPPLVS